jgi:predicted metal-dependent peptidase
MSELVLKCLQSKMLDIRPTPEEIRKVDELYIDERMRFIMSHPFFGVLLLDLDAFATGLEVKIGAVNHRGLYLHAIDPARLPETDEEGKKISKGVPFYHLTLEGRQALLVHECYHLVFEHLTMPSDFDKQLSNIAQDAVINRNIDEDDNLDLTALPEGIITPIKQYGTYTGFTIGKGSEKETFFIKDYANKDWIPIYWDLMKQLEDKYGKDNREGIAKAIKKLAGMNPLEGDCDTNGNGDSIQVEQFKAKFRLKVMSAYQAAKSRGTVPQGIERLVDKLQDPKIHWTTYLRRLMKSIIVRDDFSNKPNSRRAHLGGRGRPSVFPKVESDAIGEIVLALDTSGSMSVQDITDGLSEFKGLRDCTPFKLHFVSCDAEAYKVTTYERHEDPDWTRLHIEGGGGTDFKPVFQKVEELMKNTGKRPALLVYFTDTMGGFPEKPPDYPVIWVTNYKNAKVPWGTLVSTLEE